jgi:hypothetical protein
LRLTTTMAAEKLGGSATASELGPLYIDVIIARFHKTTVNGPFWNRRESPLGNFSGDETQPPSRSECETLASGSLYADIPFNVL